MPRVLSRRGSDLAHSAVAAVSAGLSAKNQYGPGVMTTSLQTADVFAHPDRCHLATPVRFGRRKTDQVGHLLLTSHWLQFRGTVDVSISWAEVADIEHKGSDLLVLLHGTNRTVRFCCQTNEDAQRADVTARHLTALAHSHPLQTT